MTTPQQQTDMSVTEFERRMVAHYCESLYLLQQTAASMARRDLNRIPACDAECWRIRAKEVVDELLQRPVYRWLADLPGSIAARAGQWAFLMEVGQM